MFANTTGFSSFSVDDIPAAKAFYGDTLGLPVTEENGMLQLQIPGGGTVLIYPKGNQHAPATYTVLNFRVENIDAAADLLSAAGVELLRYPDFDQDDKGIARQDGPAIGWFSDPAGNVLSIIQA